MSVSRSWIATSKKVDKSFQVLNEKCHNLYSNNYLFSSWSQ